jgi:DNA-directed RNA polymerase specialized sigma24 family protein
MSVLEGYSNQDCAILLGCTRQAVMSARARALDQIASAEEINRMQTGAIENAHTHLSN